MRQNHGAAVGKPELVAAEGRQPAGRGRRGVVEEVARIECRVAHKLENRAVKTASPGTCADIRKPRCTKADLRRHPARAGLNFLYRIHIEVGERRAAHFRIGGIRAIHRKRRFCFALAVDGKLLRKVGCAVGIGHRAGGKQQQLAEVALVQRQRAHLVARKLFAAGVCNLRAGSPYPQHYGQRFPSRLHHERHGSCLQRRQNELRRLTG
jgi:hypothetical protein